MNFAKESAVSRAVPAFSRTCCRVSWGGGEAAIKTKDKMKTIDPSPNKERWPRLKTPEVQCRKRDLVLRITDWMDDKDEPAFDVECYIGGVYDWNESESFTRWNGSGPRKSPRQCKTEAVAFAHTQIAKLL